MTKSTPKFYISPISGRLIRSDAKTYENLKQRRFNIDKDPCLYNVKSAHKCLNKLLRLYPDIIHPSSNFINIPKTYKHGSVRAFIKDKNKVVGYIDKFGKKHRLYKAIHTKRKIPVVHDGFNVLADIIQKQDKISEKDQKIIEKQITKSEPLQESENINILFNPMQNDFIPIKTILQDDEKKEIINTINKELIPTRLPPITMFSNISGIIKEYDTIVGIINKDNVIQKFPEPIRIIDEHPQKSIPGPPGPQGERGEVGPQGERGEQGEVGTSEPSIPDSLTLPETETEETMSTITEPEEPSIPDSLTLPETEETISTITEVGPEETEAEETEAEETETEETVPEETVSTKTVPEETVSTKTVPEETETEETSTKTEPEETEPEETSTKTEPEETETEETEPEETEPEETSTKTEPEETETEETEPEETETEETEPVSTITETIKPEETVSTIKPEETVSTIKPEETISTITEPEETISTITEPEETISAKTDEVEIEETVSSKTEEVEPENVIDKNIVDTLPSVTVIKSEDSSVLEQVLKESPVISKQETIEILKGLQCLDGEQLDSNENRCLPCTHYGLVWDAEHKVCKTMLKEEILKEQDKNLLSDGFVLNKLDIISDERGNVVGFLEK